MMMTISLASYSYSRFSSPPTFWPYLSQLSYFSHNLSNQFSLHFCVVPQTLFSVLCARRSTCPSHPNARYKGNRAAAACKSHYDPPSLSALPSLAVLHSDSTFLTAILRPTISWNPPKFPLLPEADQSFSSWWPTPASIRASLLSSTLGLYTLFKLSPYFKVFHNINSISSFPRHKIWKEWECEDNCTKFDYRLSSYILDEVRNA
jgi:hypothetical protein